MHGEFEPSKDLIERWRMEAAGETAVERGLEELAEAIKPEQTKPQIRTGRIYNIGGRRHQASAKGEPPAPVTFNLVDSTQIIKLSRTSGEVRVTAPYGRRLEEVMDRKFFYETAKRYKERFAEIVREERAKL